jgi:hypothetical protein
VLVTGSGPDARDDRRRGAWRSVCAPVRRTGIGGCALSGGLISPRLSAFEGKADMPRQVMNVAL